MGASLKYKLLLARRVSAPTGLRSVERLIATLVYASVALGLVLLLFARGLVPDWLFWSLTGGVVAYLVCAVIIATRRTRWAYYMAFILAVVTLAASLPQPEHYSFAEEGQVAAFAIFLLGSIVQVVLIGALVFFFVRSRRASGTVASRGQSR